jgi:hypothetical protein
MIGLAAGAVAGALLIRRLKNHHEIIEEEAPRERKFSDRKSGVGDPLATYVHDHLAGARAAIDMLQRLREDHDGEPLARFAQDLLAEIREDQDTLRELASRLGGHNRIKESAAWLGSKAAKLKLGRDSAGNFGTLQALEILALGIQGKLALWHALAAVGDRDPRLKGFDFQELADRAEQQFGEVEDWRLDVAESVLSQRRKRSWRARFLH